jgi:hypothetical protein
VNGECGYGVPLMRFEGTRTQMNAWGQRKLAKGGVAELARYKHANNEKSIDGLPAIKTRA